MAASKGAGLLDGFSDWFFLSHVGKSRGDKPTTSLPARGQACLKLPAFPGMLPSFCAQRP